MLKEKANGDTRSKYFVQLFDNFVHEGPNGFHLCLVFELLGPTVNIVTSEYLEGGERLDPETLLRISEQLLEAIAFLHELGLVHGGKNFHFLTYSLPISKLTLQ
jgi:serine/threonine-protein kinase SRPK3